MTRAVVGYLVVVLAAAGLMNYCRSWPVPPSTTKTGDEIMQWAQVVTVKVKAKPAGIWTWAVDPVQGPARIKIEVPEGASWIYSPGRTCGADGDLGALLSTDHALEPKAPIGALLVKVGGSTAGAADGTIRVAGSKTYFEISDKITAPIFLTINDELGGMGDNEGALDVTISISALPKPPAPPAPPAPAPDAAEPAAAAGGATAGGGS